MRSSQSPFIQLATINVTFRPIKHLWKILFWYLGSWNYNFTLNCQGVFSWALSQHLFLFKLLFRYFDKKRTSIEIISTVSFDRPNVFIRDTYRETLRDTERRGGKSVIETRQLITMQDISFKRGTGRIRVEPLCKHQIHPQNIYYCC